MSEKSTERLARALEGDLAPEERRALDAELAASPSLRADLASIQRLMADLSEPDPRAVEIDLRPNLNETLNRSATLQRPRGARWAALAAAAVLAAVLALGVVSFRPGHGADEFRAKGSPTEDPNRWVGLDVYRVTGDHTTSRLDVAMRAEDGLAFAYRNAGSAPFQYLLVFATDSANHVYWYYPAWSNPTETPRAIPIGRAAGAVELHEVVRHDLPLGPLTIHGLFTNEALSVLEVEQAVKQHREFAPGSVEHRIHLTVEATP